MQLTEHAMCFKARQFGEYDVRKEDCDVSPSREFKIKRISSRIAETPLSKQPTFAFEKTQQGHQPFLPRQVQGKS